MALILIDGKKYDNAIVKLEEILSLAPSSDKIRYYLAAVYEEKGNAKLAIENYEMIEPSSSYYPDANVRSANLMRKNDDVRGALNLLAAAVQKRDDSATLYAYYASLLDETRDYKPGISVLEKALKKFPDNTQLHFYLGSLKDKVGDTKACIEQMRKVIALDANHVQALNYLAYTLAESAGDLSEAEQLALRALDLQPNDGYILDTVGWVYFKKGDVEEAIRYLEAAYSQKQNESVVAEHLGDAYYVHELVDKAKEMYQRAITLENDQKKADRIRAKIVSIQNGLKDNRQPASDVSHR
jgi:tetratricopeptide (TPR) repeat protein